MKQAGVAMWMSVQAVEEAEGRSELLRLVHDGNRSAFVRLMELDEVLEVLSEHGIRTADLHSRVGKA
jgi:hypothetical protein